MAMTSESFVPSTLGTFAAQRVRNLIYQPASRTGTWGCSEFSTQRSIGFQFRAEAYNVWNASELVGNPVAAARRISV